MVWNCAIFLVKTIRMRCHIIGIGKKWFEIYLLIWNPFFNVIFMVSSKTKDAARTAVIVVTELNWTEHIFINSSYICNTWVYMTAYYYTIHETWNLACQCKTTSFQQNWCCVSNNMDLRSGPMLCGAWSRSILLGKVI